MNESAFHPEDRARSLIDRQLSACGWVIQSKAEMKLSVRQGVSIRSFQTELDSVEHALFFERKLYAVIDAKPERSTLSRFLDCMAGSITEVPHYLVRNESRAPLEQIASGSETSRRTHPAEFEISAGLAYLPVETTGSRSRCQVSGTCR